ncbi:MAG: hypothetical protein AB8E74_01385 [Prochlorococcus sp.]|nr:hypothetical protein [Prochlorococcaceae cyanobacterium Fu_MAG_50]
MKDLPVLALIQALEDLSRDRPDLLVRLSGVVALDRGRSEPLEVLIFRGFSSCTTHPTASNPDLSVLPEAASLEAAELLKAPLLSADQAALWGPVPAEELLDRGLWDRPPRA